MDELEKIEKIEQWYENWEGTLRGWKFNECMDELDAILDECPCSGASREHCASCQDLPVWYFDNIKNDEIKRLTRMLEIAKNLVMDCNIFDIYERQCRDEKLIPEREEDEDE